MNIMFLALQLDFCATLTIDKHCVKLILEICQMLYTAQHLLRRTPVWIEVHQSQLKLNPYRKAYMNHPTTKWVRQHRNNYTYTCKLGLALCEEYTLRYSKRHACQDRIEWLLENSPIPNFPFLKIDHFCSTVNIPPNCTPVPLAMPAHFYNQDLILAYRSYYVSDKSKLATSNYDKDRIEIIKELLQESRNNSKNIKCLE